MTEISVNIENAARIIELQGAAAGNRLSVGEMQSLAAAIATEPSNSERLIILRAEGDDFCLGRLPEPLPSRAWPTSDTLSAYLAKPILSVYEAIRGSRLPVVAVVNGRAEGFGCVLALASDLTFSHKNSVYCLPELNSDIPPVLAMTGLFGRLPPKTVTDLVLSRRSVGAAEALSLGLVNRVSEDPAKDVAELEQSLADCHPKAVSSVKAFLGMTVYGGQTRTADIASQILGGALSEIRQ